jgi:hypothetical protein
MYYASYEEVQPKDNNYHATKANQCSIGNSLSSPCGSPAQIVSQLVLLH